MLTFLRMSFAVLGMGVTLVYLLLGLMMFASSINEPSVSTDFSTQTRGALFGMGVFGITSSICIALGCIAALINRFPKSTIGLLAFGTILGWTAFYFSREYASLPCSSFCGIQDALELIYLAAAAIITIGSATLGLISYQRIRPTRGDFRPENSV